MGVNAEDFPRRGIRVFFWVATQFWRGRFSVNHDKLHLLLARALPVLKHWRVSREQ
jgi:hypothetical protein